MSFNCYYSLEVNNVKKNIGFILMISFKIKVYTYYFIFMHATQDVCTKTSSMNEIQFY